MDLSPPPDVRCSISLEPFESEKERLLKSLLVQYPGGIPRTRVLEATGGLIAPKTLANLANQGNQPEFFRVRGKVVYPVSVFVEWLYREARS